MNFVWTAILLAGCLQAQPKKQPSPEKIVQKAFESARSKSSLRVRMNGTVNLPKSDPMKIDATALQLKGGRLFLKYKATGEVLDFVIRENDRAILWHPVLEQWMPADQLRKGGIGLGIQNPHQVLGTLAKSQTGAELLRKDDNEQVFRMELDGPKLKKILEDLIQSEDIRWETTKAKATVVVDRKTGLLKSAKTEAEIALEDGNKVTYEGTVEVEGYDEEKRLKFYKRGPSGKPTEEIPVGEQAWKLLGVEPDTGD